MERGFKKIQRKRLEEWRENLSSKFAWLKVLAGPKGISSALRAARYHGKY